MFDLRAKRQSVCYIVMKDGRRTDVIAQQFGVDGQAGAWGAWRPIEDDPKLQHKFLARGSTQEELFADLEGKI
jgi:hypothetical protein